MKELKFIASEEEFELAAQAKQNIERFFNRHQRPQLTREEQLRRCQEFAKLKPEEVNAVLIAEHKEFMQKHYDPDRESGLIRG